MDCPSLPDFTAATGLEEPAFTEPWHAQVFALTVHLNEAGQFTWAEWVNRFSTVLRQHGAERSLNGGEDYFNAWLATLEAFLRDRGMASAAQVEHTRAAWEEAYLTTPHGAPVTLKQV
ncbi:nitrile hydratase accessory protein [Phaeobacter sp. CNT1-3]|jgi:nitrile hydratase accessory protein|nr:nitrile hydratase accessory protein [Phaeobacter sp. CNT1-3]